MNQKEIDAVMRAQMDWAEQHKREHIARLEREDMTNEEKITEAVKAALLHWLEHELEFENDVATMTFAGTLYAERVNQAVRAGFSEAHKIVEAENAEITRAIMERLSKISPEVQG